jgi:hypothetical protein
LESLKLNEKEVYYFKIKQMKLYFILFYFCKIKCVRS